jgi:hypothetical protein
MQHTGMNKTVYFKLLTFFEKEKGKHKIKENKEEHINRKQKRNKR